MVTRRLISALLIALTISGVFTFWLSRKVTKSAVPPPAKQHYVAAAGNLEAGEVLKAESLKLIDWPVGTPLEGGFANLTDVVGRTVMFPLSTGEPITTRQLSAAGAGAGLAVKIPDGMRAISLKSDQVVGVAGYLLPGVHVDVFMSYHPISSTNVVSPGLVTSIILQDVEVITAGQKIQPDPEGKASPVDVVTLLVTPEQAEKAALASSMGSTHFVLRNGTDRSTMAAEKLELASTDHSAPPLPQGNLLPHRAVRIAEQKPAASSNYQVETTLGTKASVETFK